MGDGVCSGSGGGRGDGEIGNAVLAAEVFGEGYRLLEVFGGASFLDDGEEGVDVVLVIADAGDVGEIFAAAGSEGGDGGTGLCF